MALFVPDAPHGWQWAPQTTLKQGTEMVQGCDYLNLTWKKLGPQSGLNLEQAFRDFCLRKVPQDFNVTQGFSTYKWSVVAVYGDQCVCRHKAELYDTMVAKPTLKHRFLLHVVNETPPFWHVRCTNASGNQGDVQAFVFDVDQPKTWGRVMGEATEYLVRRGYITEIEAPLCQFIGRFCDEWWPIKPVKSENVMDRKKDKTGAKSPKSSKESKKSGSAKDKDKKNSKNSKNVIKKR